MSQRIMIDVSAQFRMAGTTPNRTWRTEREIALRLLRDTTLCTLPIVYRSGVAWAMDRDTALAWLTGDGSRETVEVAAAGQEAAASDHAALSRDAVLRQALRLAQRAAVVAARRAIRLAPEHAQSDVRQSLRHAEKAIRAVVRRPPPVAVRPPAVQPAPAPGRLSTIVHAAKRDILWTCGPYVDGIPLRRLAETQAATGLRVASLCFGVESVRQSDGMSPALSDDVVGARTIDQLDGSALIFCVTRQVQEDLHYVAAASGRPAPHTAVLDLGTDPLSRAAPSSRCPSPPIARVTTRPFALAVGTVEASKNYDMLLDVWQLLSLEPLFDLDLVIVGREGDAAANLLTRLRREPSLGVRVHWFRDVTDRDLVTLYRQCRVFLCPRLESAAALPIAEALTFGRSVVSSERLVLPEATDSRVTRRHPLQLGAWIAAVRDAAVARDTVSDVRLPTWDDAAAVVRDTLLALPD